MQIDVSQELRSLGKPIPNRINWDAARLSSLIAFLQKEAPLLLNQWAETIAPELRDAEKPLTLKDECIEALMTQIVDDKRQPLDLRAKCAAGALGHRIYESDGTCELEAREIEQIKQAIGMHATTPTCWAACKALENAKTPAVEKKG